MSKLDETIKYMKEKEERLNKHIISPDWAIFDILKDIALSLAIIADKMSCSRNYDNLYERRTDD